MKKPIIILIIVIIVASGGWYWNIKQERIRPEDGQVRLSGVIEALDARLSLKTAGQILERPVKESDRVEKGQILLRLDGIMQSIQVERIQALRAQASARLEELQNGSLPQEIALAQADLDRALAAQKAADANLQKATSDFQRNVVLFESQTISPTQYDTVKNVYDLAHIKVEDAVANVVRARQVLSLRQSGPREELIDQARASLALSEANLKQAQEELGYTTLRAPFTGTVLTSTVEVGEWVQPGKTVMMLGQLDEVWLRAYLNETDLGRVRLGQPVAVQVDSYPDRNFQGLLSYISDVAEFTPKQVQTYEERVKLVYRLKITLPNPDGLLKPGMPAQAVLK